jgi:hypothetical protein
MLPFYCLNDPLDMPANRLNARRSLRKMGQDTSHATSTLVFTHTHSELEVSVITKTLAYMLFLPDGDPESASPAIVAETTRSFSDVGESFVSFILFLRPLLKPGTLRKASRILPSSASFEEGSTHTTTSLQ